MNNSPNSDQQEEKMEELKFETKVEEIEIEPKKIEKKSILKLDTKNSVIRAILSSPRDRIKYVGSPSEITDPSAIGPVELKVYKSKSMTGPELKSKINSIGTPTPKPKKKMNKSPGTPGSDLDSEGTSLDQDTALTLELETVNVQKQYEQTMKERIEHSRVNYISILPPDIFAEIMTYLPQPETLFTVNQVSKQFYNHSSYFFFSLKSR
jgi:hypothetical protein